MVPVQVQHLDSGEPIGALTASDFEVRDEAELVAIQVFEHRTLPCDVVFLADFLGAAPATVWNQLNGEIRSSVRELGPGDRVAAMNYSSRPVILYDLTADKDGLHPALFGKAGRSKRVGSTGRLLDGIVSAVTYIREIERQPERKTMLVLLTDGKESKSEASPRSAITAALSAEVTVSAYMIKTSEWPRRSGSMGSPGLGTITWGKTKLLSDQPYPVAAIVEATGGDLIIQYRGLSGLWQVLRNFKARYFLGYYAPKPSGGDFRRITVKLTGSAAIRYPKAVLTTRSGYYP